MSDRPYPRFVSCVTTLMSLRPASKEDVPSVEPSSTTTT